MVSCGCGFESSATECPLAMGEIADAHARVCDFAPMLPYTCRTCGDFPEWCPEMSRVRFIRTDSIIAAGCWTLAASELVSFARKLT